MRTYLARLRNDLAAIGVRAPIQVMASNGGMMGITAASEKPVFAVASGPAAGVTGAARVGERTGDRDAIAFDMGGTTAKAAIVQAGQPSLTNEYEFRDGISSPSRFVKGGGYVLKVPAIDIAEVGAGGGSIARIDAGGLLCVGPESAGAVPGPACYALGNVQPTVTDANMVLGYLNATALAGGSLAVQPALAHAAIERHIAAPLGLSVLEAAHGIRNVANVNMARAIRAVTVERGRDPRDMSLIAFGGSGPVHAVDVARILGIRRIVAPVMAGVFCSAGMLAADAERDFLRTVLRRLDQCEPHALQTIVDALRQEGLVALAAEGYGPERVSAVVKADCRYLGQSSDLSIPLSRDAIDPAVMRQLREDFQRAYRETFGYANDEPIEIVNLRSSVRGRGSDRLSFADMRVDAEALAGQRGVRKVSFERGAAPIDTPVVPRAQIDAEQRAGPLIVESYDTTIVVPPGVQAWADTTGNIILELRDAP
jgi:N-methylhydantoinase A